MPYRQNFPIPSVIDPPRTCLCLPIPDSTEWRAILAGLISELTHWFNYERTGDGSGSECAAVWKEIFTQIEWGRMSCCCGDFTVIFMWTEEGELEQSDDGGVTYTPAPQQDPRNSSPLFPPVPGDVSDEKRCIAAAGMALLVKEGVGDQLTEDMGRYSLAQLIEDWVTTVIQTSNPFQALINIVANQIFALLISAVIAALTEEVYDLLMCAFYCNMEDDLSFTNGGWIAVREDISANIAGIAGVFLEHLVFLLGKVGLTNLARSQAATEGDCGECDCGEVLCWEYDFTVDSTGVTAPLGSAYGLWVDGEGWQVPFHAGFNQLDAVFAFDWGGGSGNVTEIQFDGYADTANCQQTANGVTIFNTFAGTGEETVSIEYDGSFKDDLANQEWLKLGAGGGDLFYLRRIRIYSTSPMSGFTGGHAC